MSSVWTYVHTQFFTFNLSVIFRNLGGNRNVDYIDFQGGIVTVFKLVLIRGAEHSVTGEITEMRTQCD